MSAAGGAPGPLLQVDNLSKHFGGVRALDGVGLAVQAGEVHGLLGHNGSGKSTLIKVLAGFHEPDPGARIRLRGQPVRLPMPAGMARELGISFVHQHLAVIPSMTVLENLLLGDLATDRRWYIRWADEAARARELFDRFGLPLDPHAAVGDISPVERALLAIVRAFRDMKPHGGLLILDEPTPFLPRRDVQRLFALVRRVVEGGASVIFVSHDIDEVREITDRATVLRDGRVAGSFVTSEVGKDRIVEMIVGRPVARQTGRPSFRTGQIAARVEGLRAAMVRDVSFDVARGEILGLAGLIGSGYDQVPSLVYGAARPQAGSLALDGKALDLTRMTPARAVAAGCVLVPADRQNKAVIGTLSVAENVGMPAYRRVTSPWAISSGRLMASAARLAEAFDVRPRDPGLPIGSLSGGNQQKAVVAKWLQLQPRLILLDEPTQGVDVGAREQIFRHLREAARQGAAIIVASSDFEQLESLCDRVLVFAQGRIASALEGNDVTKHAIAEHCFGADADKEIAS